MQFQMGNWQLEVAKMALYVSFPVALFHYFNQPENFDEWVRKMQPAMNPPGEAAFREEVKKVARELQEREEKRLLKEMNENQTK